MNSREIILANIEHSGAPRPGLNFDGGRRDDFVGAGVGEPLGYRPKRWVEGEFEFYDDPWGNLWRRMKDGCFKGEVHKAAIEDWSQLETYEPPRYDVDSCVAKLRSVFDQPTDKFKLAHIGGWIFDNARYVRKLEVYLMDMALYPEELRRLHELVARTYEVKIQAAGKAGADGIMIGEDMGTQSGLLFSPTMWREYFGELYTRLFGMAHEFGMKILMHSCGQNWQIVPDLLKAGVDCFQFDQPTVYNLPLLAETLRRHRAALWSPVDIQKILPTGNRDIIVRGAVEMLDTFKGSLICKNYPDLAGIGVKAEWDQWAYEAILDHAGCGSGGHAGAGTRSAMHPGQAVSRQCG